MGDEVDFSILRTEALHGEGAIESPSFRTAYHAFLLIEAGKGSYTIDGETFPLGAGSYYFTNPGHVKSFRMEETVRGYIICFTDRALQTHYAGEIGRDFPFLFDQTIPVMQLEAADFERAQAYCRLLLSTSEQASPFREQLLAHQLVALLYLTKELLQRQGKTLQLDKRPAEIATDFKRQLNGQMLRLIKGLDPQPWQLTDYAEALQVHPNYLSQVVKAETGFTVKQLIDERLVAEATSLLQQSYLTVAEVAYRLGFDDASNFSRFFKRKTGQSPSKFRT